jgi:hypothetical protein
VYTACDASGEQRAEGRFLTSLEGDYYMFDNDSSTSTGKKDVSKPIILEYDKVFSKTPVYGIYNLTQVGIKDTSIPLRSYPDSFSEMVHGNFVVTVTEMV